VLDTDSDGQIDGELDIYADDFVDYEKNGDDDNKKWKLKKHVRDNIDYITRICTNTGVEIDNGQVVIPSEYNVDYISARVYNDDNKDEIFNPARPGPLPVNFDKLIDDMLDTTEDLNYEDIDLLGTGTTKGQRLINYLQIRNGNFCGGMHVGIRIYFKNNSYRDIYGNTETINLKPETDPVVIDTCTFYENNRALCAANPTCKFVQRHGTNESEIYKGNCINPSKMKLCSDRNGLVKDGHEQKCLEVAGCKVMTLGSTPKLQHQGMKRCVPDYFDKFAPANDLSDAGELLFNEDGGITPAARNNYFDAANNLKPATEWPLTVWKSKLYAYSLFHDGKLI
jgi:hypothetical protein